MFTTFLDNLNTYAPLLSVSVSASAAFVAWCSYKVAKNANTVKLKATLYLSGPTLEQMDMMRLAITNHGRVDCSIIASPTMRTNGGPHQPIGFEPQPQVDLPAGRTTAFMMSTDLIFTMLKKYSRSSVEQSFDTLRFETVHGFVSVEISAAIKSLIRNA